MRETMKKISVICKLIFSYGIMIVLFAGGLTFLGYLAAFCIGGSAAEAICVFIYKQFFPIIFYAANFLVLFGLLAMYLGGEVALTADNKKTK